MNAMQTKRLLKLAAFLRTMPKEKFDFSVIMDQSGKPPLEALKAGHTRCGTVGCAVGWMPAVWPRSLKWNLNGIKFADGCDVGTWSTVQEFFGISYDAALYAFNPGGFGYTDEAGRWRGFFNNLSENATPKQVAAHIERFVKRGGKPPRVRKSSDAHLGF